MSEDRQRTREDELADDVLLEMEEQESEAEEVEIEAGDEPEEGGEPQAEPEQLPAQRRRPGRDERQRAELRRLKEEVENTKRELQRVQTPQQQAPQVDYARQAQIAAYERDQLPLLPVDQQIAYHNQKNEQRFNQALLFTQLQTAERIDKSNWDRSCRDDRRRERFASQVEERLATERRAGRDFDRETIYRFLLGDEIERQAARRAPQQRAAARQRVNAQRTQPTGAGSDARRDRGGRDNDDSLEALERRIFQPGKPLNW